MRIIKYILAVSILLLVSVQVYARPIFEKYIDDQSIITIDEDKKTAQRADIAKSKVLNNLLGAVTDSTNITPSGDSFVSANSVHSESIAELKGLIADYKTFISDGAREFFATDYVAIDSTDTTFKAYGSDWQDEVFSINGGSLQYEQDATRLSSIQHMAIDKGNFAFVTSPGIDLDLQNESYSHIGGGANTGIGILEICAMILISVGIIYIFVHLGALEICAMILFLLGITYYFTRLS